MATTSRRSGNQGNSRQPQYGGRNNGQQSGEYGRQYAENYDQDEFDNDYDEEDDDDDMQGHYEGDDYENDDFDEEDDDEEDDNRGIQGRYQQEGQGYGGQNQRRSRRGFGSMSGGRNQE